MSMLCSSVLQCAAMCCSVLKQPLTGLNRHCSVSSFIRPKSIYMSTVTTSLGFNFKHIYPCREIYCKSVCTTKMTDYGVATISRLLKIIRLFCRKSFLYRALLQKRSIFLRSLLIIATPYRHKDDMIWIAEVVSSSFRRPIRGISPK